MSELIEVLSQEESSWRTKYPNLNYAINDIWLSIKLWRVWMMLGYQDIKAQYRRSALGPWWITISMAITISAMGFLYGTLFRMNLEVYFPLLTAGMIAWNFISMVTNDSVEAFSNVAGFMKQIKMPYFLHILRMVWRNFLNFLHTVIIVPLVILIFHHVAKINWHLFLFIPGLAICFINGAIYSLLLGLLGTRYRDVAQIIKNFMQVIFFITPVMWTISSLPAKYGHYFKFNPFYSFLEIMRAPLLGQVPSIKIYFVVLVVTLFGAIAALRLFARHRSKIVYWV